MEKLNDETTKYNKERQLTLDYINYQIRLQQNAITDFNDIDASLCYMVWHYIYEEMYIDALYKCKGH